jgi:hypothetical protein
MEKFMMTVAVDGKIVVLDKYPDMHRIESSGNMWWNNEWRPVIDVHRQWIYRDGKIDGCKGFQIELSKAWDPFYRSNHPKKVSVTA